MELDLNAPEVQEALKAATAAETLKIREALENEYKGLKSNKDAILAEKKALADELNSIKSQFEGVDLEQIKKLQAAAEKDVRLKLITTGDVTAIDSYLADELNKRTEMMRRDSETKLQAIQRQNEDAQKKITEMEEQRKQFTIDTKVREAAAKYVQPEMMDYVTRMGRETFTFEDDGNLVIRDRDGSLKLGRDGASPMTPEEWLLMMKDKMPYIFQPSAGSGATSSNKGRSGVKYKEDLSNASAKAKFIGDHGMNAYLDLPNKK